MFSRCILIVAVLFISVFSFSQDIDLIRKNFIDAGKDIRKSKDFLELLNSLDYNHNALFMAYHAMAYSMTAEIISSPMNKYRFFSSGKTKMETAIAADTKSVEIRYLRFEIQSNIPPFLNYNNIAEDKKIIISNLRAFLLISNSDLIKTIAYRLIRSDQLTPKEKNYVYNFFVKNSVHVEPVSE